MLRDQSVKYYELPLSERIRLAREHINRPDSDYELNGDD